MRVNGLIEVKLLALVSIACCSSPEIVSFIVIHVGKPLGLKRYPERPRGGVPVGMEYSGGVTALQHKGCSLPSVHISLLVVYSEIIR